MNKHDRSQLSYIMNLSDEEFDEWAHSITPEDIQYAIELIQQARLETAMQEQELLDELEGHDMAEAKSVLKKFRL